MIIILFQEISLTTFFKWIIWSIIASFYSILYIHICYLIFLHLNIFIKINSLTILFFYKFIFKLLYTYFFISIVSNYLYYY